jgi:drug/metabolite transporter (DMT)-like permease
MNVPLSKNGNKFQTTDFWMLLTTLIWAVNLSLIKFSLREFSLFGYNGIRLILSSLLFLGILAFSKDGFRVAKQDLWKIAGLGIIGTTVYQLVFMEGLRLTTASTTSMIMPMTPVFIALLSHFFKLERIHWAAWMGIVISSLGFYLIINGQGAAFTIGRDAWRGDLLVLIASFIWALYTVFSKPLLERIDPVKLAALTTSIGTLFYLPFAASKIGAVPVGTISWGAWGALLYSAILALVVGFVAWFASVRKVGNTKTGIYSNLNPVFATFFAVIFLSERVTLTQAGGAVVIFAGVYLTRSGYKFFQKTAR